MRDDDQRYTYRLLIERPVDDAQKVIERAILSDEGTALVKELREEEMSDKGIAQLIKGVDFDEA